MRTSSGFCQIASKFPESIGRRLNRFVIATILAGVGLLALARPAAAEIVYTSTDIKIGANSSYSLDLNNDGVRDFTIWTHFSGPPPPPCKPWTYSAFVDETPASGNGAENSSSPARLKEGDQIGPSQTFYGSTGAMAYAYDDACPGGQGPGHGGKWLNASGYLGLMFQINGETHYGWAQLKVGDDTATLTGYAYETIAGTAINAGQGTPPNFKITASPTSATVSPGQSTTSTLTLTPVFGFSGTVALTCKVPIGYGLSCGISPSSVTLNGTNSETATLSINTSSTTPAAIYSINAKGTSGTLVHGTPFALAVQ